MNFKNLKKYFACLLLTLFIIPQFALAYSSSLIPGGDPIGVSLNSKGILVVGLYEVNGKNPGNDAGLKVGDIITSINNKSITTISEMVNIISK